MLLGSRARPMLRAENLTDIFKSHKLKRKTDLAPNTGPASTHIPTTSQFTSRYHQTTGDRDDICPSICPSDSCVIAV
jgi:hypothetical protein